MTIVYFDLVHQGLPVGSGKKYILRTDIIYTGEYDKNIEKDEKYKLCKKLFTMAQNMELDNNPEKSNELFERSISMRYLNTDKRDMDKIKEYLSNEWEQINLQSNLVFMPQKIKRQGCEYKFTYNEILQKNGYKLIRVCAVYSLLLYANRLGSDTSIISHNRITGESKVVYIEQFLKKIYDGTQYTHIFETQEQYDDMEFYTTDPDSETYCMDGDYDTDFESLQWRCNKGKPILCEKKWNDLNDKEKKEVNSNPHYKDISRNELQYEKYNKYCGCDCDIHSGIKKRMNCMDPEIGYSYPADTHKLNNIQYNKINNYDEERILVGGIKCNTVIDKTTFDFDVPYKYILVCPCQDGTFDEGYSTGTCREYIENIKEIHIKFNIKKISIHTKKNAFIVAFNKFTSPFNHAACNCDKEFEYDIGQFGIDCTEKYETKYSVCYSLVKITLDNNVITAEPFFCIGL